MKLEEECEWTEKIKMNVDERDKANRGREIVTPSLH